MLPMFEKDKANHAIYGVVFYLIASFLITPIFSLIAVLLTAVAKEFFDYYHGKTFSYGDIMATMIGGVIGFLISLIS
jgi:VanZ family protein